MQYKHCKEYQEHSIMYYAYVICLNSIDLLKYTSMLCFVSVSQASLPTIQASADNLRQFADYLGPLADNLVQFADIPCQASSPTTSGGYQLFRTQQGPFVLSYGCSPFCSLYISYGAAEENLFDSYGLPRLVIISFIPMTSIFNSRVILYGEVISQSLLWYLRGEIPTPP